jgi:hypothetical protein
LTLEVVNRYRQLAVQPLLLLMLALYDADGNQLQSEASLLADADLYDKLLQAFTRREMHKGNPHLTETELNALVEQELERLAIAALAMFNRGSQYVAEEDLNDDLAALLLARPDVSADRSHQTDAQRLVGRFFFVHIATARYSNMLRTYEFLHATFGEYLVAWFVSQALPRPPVRRALAVVRLERIDGLFGAILSHAILAERAQVLTFLEQITGGIADRAPIQEQILEAFRTCFNSIAWQAFTDYRPTTKSLVDRMAIYSANLLLVALILSPDGHLPLSTVFDIAEEDEIRNRWYRLGQLWLSAGGHNAVHLISDEIEVTDSDAGPGLQRRRRRTEIAGGPVGNLMRTNALVREPDLAILLRAVEPLATIFGPEGLLPSETNGIPIRILLTLLFHRDEQERDEQYFVLINSLEQHRDLPDRGRYVELLLEHLAGRNGYIKDPEFFNGLLRLIENDPSAGPAIIRRFLRCLVRLSPTRATHRRAIVRQALFVMMSVEHAATVPPSWTIQEFVNDLLDDTAADLQLVPVMLEVFSSPSLWRVADYPGLPSQLQAWLHALPPASRAVISDGDIREIRRIAGSPIQDHPIG